MYLEGKGFDAIARTLTREGCPTPAQVVGKRNAGLYWHGTSTTVKAMCAATITSTVSMFAVSIA
ncbi:hypothetical protein [Aneurinibacillus aneurinilyticus]|uniref:hypothetical protein n=1 Tax=Aneurinibacillus aneurinilyticus TaxID=1391 RepID=UPI0035261E26